LIQTDLQLEYRLAADRTSGFLCRLDDILRAALPWARINLLQPGLDF
jgi:hypothetical protein